MKIAFAIIAVCALAACSQTPSGGNSLASANARAAGAPASEPQAPVSGASTPLPATTTTAPAADDASVLTQYHWQLANAVDKSGQRIDALFARAGQPVQLDFDAQGVAIGNTCNRLRGSYSVAGGKLTVGNLASTRMTCTDPALAALDAAAGRIFAGHLHARPRRARQPAAPHRVGQRRRHAHLHRHARGREQRRRIAAAILLIPAPCTGFVQR